MTVGANGAEPPWVWDPTLFAGAAPYYEAGRLPYAPDLVPALAAALGLTPDAAANGRLLDVGCGPGTIALRCAACFARVVGIDPDAEMLQEARHLAAARGVRNARWVRMRAEALPARLGRFRAVTFAASLHWLDRAQVFATVRDMLAADGAAVHVDNPGYRQSGPALPWQLPPPPEQAMEELRVRYLGADRRAGQSVRNNSPGDEDAVFRAVGFAGPEVVVVPDPRVLQRSVDELVAERFSYSGTAPHLFGARKDSFERDLRLLLWDASPTGFFSVPLSDNLLKIWRPVGGRGGGRRRLAAPAV